MTTEKIAAVIRGVYDSLNTTEPRTDYQEGQFRAIVTVASELAIAIDDVNYYDFVELATGFKRE